MVGKNGSNYLPPGFRFHPTDEELMMYYLRNQVRSRPCPVSIIPEVDIYKFDPWELPDKTQIGENEWYFFSPRDRKYPNGSRPNRAAVSGYWKATGTDKAIQSGSKNVGVKKALVFYKGRPPKGVKTDWIMHEYRLSDQSSSSQLPYNKHSNGSMRLDDWVLCRIYKKKSVIRHCEQQQEEQRVVIADDDSFAHKTEATSDQHQQGGAAMQEFKFPRTCSLTHLWELGYMPQFTMDDQNAYNQEISIPSNNSKPQFSQASYPEAAAVLKFEVMINDHQSIFENPVYHLQ